MKKQMLPILAITIACLSSSCNIFHEHAFGEWQFNGSGHYKECSCGYTLAQSSSKHIDEDKDEACDLCHYPMKYEIDSLSDLSWYLLYYYEVSQYDYLSESNMKPHSIREMNFKNTLTYHERTSYVSFFNEYLTTLPARVEYIKSNTEYYSYNQGSMYIQVDVPAEYYLYETQEIIRYGSSGQYCDYERFTNTDAKFQTIHDIDETTSSVSLEKRIYESAEAYNEHNMSFKNEIIHSVASEISYFIQYYLHVEFVDGQIVLPELSYFDSLDIKTENGVVYFSVAKNDGETFCEDDIRYTINGTIDLKTYNLSYNIKKSYYFNGVLKNYEDYDYDLTLTSDPIEINFDFSGEFEEIYIKNDWLS